MKKFMVTSLTVLATVFLIGAAAAGVFLYQNFLLLRIGQIRACGMESAVMRSR